MIEIIEHWSNCLSSQEDVRSSKTNTIITDNLRNLAIQTIPFIGSQVIANGETVALDWGHFEDFVLSRLELDDPLNDFMHPHILTALFQYSEHETKNSKHVKITFKSAQHALASLHFLHHILPITYPNYPSLNDQTLAVNLDQHFFMIRMMLLGKNGLTASFTKNFYLKTLRADSVDFSSSFLTTLFNTDEGKRAFQNLRPKNRSAYIIRADGQIISRLDKKQNHAESKKGFTQIQSVTFIDDMHLSSAFGFSRRDKLYGLMTHHDDLMIQQFLKYDAGTVTRPFETNDLGSAHQQAIRVKRFSSLKIRFDLNQRDEFEKANMTARIMDSHTNEVLARLRFNPHKSFVSICANTFNSRLLAFDFAEELLENFTASMLEKGQVVNPNFRLPIVIYLKPDPSKKPLYKKVLPILEGHELSLYSKKMRQQDVEQCHIIYRDKAHRHECYKKHDFEFLLGLEELIPEIFFDKTDGAPLALFMLNSGYARMLIRLLRPARLKKMLSTDPNILNVIFDKLLQQGLIAKNNVIISELIRIEAFELAKKLIDATNSNVMGLKYREAKLTHYLVENGSPRQINFVGLQYLLLTAANYNYWITVRLCLKEIKQIDQSTLNELLTKASKQKQHSEIALLLKLGAGNDINVNSAIFDANLQKPIDWTSIELFLKLYKSPENIPEFSRSLILALRHKKFKLTRDLLKIAKSQSWRVFGREKFQFQSSLFYVVKFSLNDLLEQAYEHESSHQDEESVTRLRLAFDLAKTQNNTPAIEFLQTKIDSHASIDFSDAVTGVCRLVFEAYILEEKELAEWRLFHYGQTFDVLPRDCNNVVDGLNIIIPAYGKVIPTICKKKPYTYPFTLIANIYLYYLNYPLYKSLEKIVISFFEPDNNYSESEISRKLLEEFPLEHIQSLKDIIKDSTRLNTWIKNLTIKLAQTFPQEYNKSKTDREKEKIRTQAYIELALYILDIITIDSTHYDSIISIFTTVFELKHSNAIHSIFSKPLLIQEIGGDFLNAMIKKPLQSIHFGLDEFNNYLTKYSFSVKKEHILLAIKEKQYWKIAPLVDAMNNDEFDNPSNFWAFLELWITIKFIILGNPNDCSDILTRRLGPILNGHYTLIYSMIMIEDTFKDYSGPWSFSSLTRWNIYNPFRTIADNVKTKHRTCDSIDNNYWRMQKKILTILNNYFSHTTDFDTPPNQQILLSTYNNLLYLLTSTMPTYSFDFFRLGKTRELTSVLNKLLSTANQLFYTPEDIDNHQSKTVPDPADIVFYL